MSEQEHNKSQAIVKVTGTAIEKVSSGLVRRGMEDLSRKLSRNTIVTIVNRRVFSGQPMLEPIKGDAVFDSNGNFFALRDDENKLFYVWQIEDMKLIRKICSSEYTFNYKFSTDGDLFAYFDGSSINIWQILQGNRICSISITNDTLVEDLSFSNDGKLIAASLLREGDVSKICIWHVADSILLSESIEFYDTCFSDVAFSPDDCIVITNGKYFRATDCKLIKSLSGFDDTCDDGVKFNPDGNLLTTWCLGSIHLWNLNDGTLVAETNLRKQLGDYNDIHDISGTKDGSLIAAHYDNDVYILDAFNLECLHKIYGIEDLDLYIIAITFTQNGLLIFGTDGDDKYVLLEIKINTIWK